MSHSQLVDQLAVVQSLLLGKLQNFMQLQIFVVLARCMAGSSSWIEVIWWVYSLGLVQHLMLHLHLLLNVLLSVLIFFCIVLIRCRNTNCFWTSACLLLWRSSCMTAAVMAMGCVGMSISRLSFLASCHRAIVVLCRLAIQGVVAPRHSSYQQTLESACIGTRRFFVFRSLWIWP